MSAATELAMPRVMRGEIQAGDAALPLTEPHLRLEKKYRERAQPKRHAKQKLNRDFHRSKSCLKPTRLVPSWHYRRTLPPPSHHGESAPVRVQGLGPSPGTRLEAGDHPLVLFEQAVLVASPPGPGNWPLSSLLAMAGKRPFGRSGISRESERLALVQWQREFKRWIEDIGYSARWQLGVEDFAAVAARQSRVVNS